jgi:hypothetical protein
MLSTLYSNSIVINLLDMNPNLVHDLNTDLDSMITLYNNNLFESQDVFCAKMDSE